MNETLLTVKQAADRLQVETHTVRHWLRLGRVHGVKIGRDWRISARELSARVSGKPARIPARHNPLAAALALGDDLRAVIESGTHGRIDAAQSLRDNREERDRESANG